MRSAGDARGQRSASAQSSAPLTSNRATGENYHVEISGSLWDPTPSIFISSESLEGILGSRIDFVEDLGIEKSWFTQLRVVGRPAEKHKFRFDTPIESTPETVLSRTIIFNGISFPVSIPIESDHLARLPLHLRVGLRLPRPRVRRHDPRSEVPMSARP